MLSESVKWNRALVLLVAVAFAACGPTDGTGQDAGGDLIPDANEEPTDAGSDGGQDAGPDTDGGVEIALELLKVTPSRGSLAGGSLVVFTGRGFVEGFAARGGQAASDATTITFGGNPALDINVIDDDTIEVRSPAGVAALVDVKLVNPNGEATCKDCFRFFEPIEITRVSPAQGSVRGGDEVTLTGKGFVSDALVLFAGTAATHVVASDGGKTLTVRTPPGVSGSTDVGVVGTNTSGFLRRSFLYLATKRVESVEPVAAPLAGGVEVVIRGEAFGSDAKVWFGDVEATGVQVVSNSEIVATAPASLLPGAVDVTVTDRRDSAVLPRGFAFYDTSRDLQLYGLTPRQGPVGGGTCAQGARTCLSLSGTGFSGGNLEVKVGLTNVSPDAIRVVSDNLLEVDLPARPSGVPGVVDIQARTERNGAVLEQAFGYVIPLFVNAVTPPKAQASETPPIVATVTGAGFDDTCQVFFGAVPGTVNQASNDGTTLSVTVPAGSAGVVDIRVECGDSSTLLFQRESLASAFTFEEPLKLHQVDPETGSQAGNTAVSLYGAGFIQGMQVLFGTKLATDVQVKGPHLAIVRSPRGDPGSVDVEVRQNPQAVSRLPGAFSYQNPVSILGGASGGPMSGTLNVSVLNSTPYMSGPVAGATISINNDEFVGTTDDRGQVTFSDPALLKAVTVTGSKKDWAASTIARVNARNVTLFMERNEAGELPDDPPPPDDAPPPPPPPGPATLTGRVCGFKTPPNFVLASGQKLEARVYMTASNVYSAAPFGRLGTPSIVTADCGRYSILTRRYGSLALYAEFGVRDDSVSPSTFTPLLMGIRRALESVPEKTSDNDIILDMQRDLDIPVHIDSASPLPGRKTMNTVYSYLDLGGEGVVPLAKMEDSASDFVFKNHPRVSGEGLLFLNMAAVYNVATGDITPPYSFFYRRQYGDPAVGVDIGPMLAFTRFSLPADGEAFTGSLGWTFTEGRKPDVTQVYLEQPAGFMSKPIWDVVLPGTELGVSLPPAALGGIDPGATLYWTMMTARSPRFDYDRFGFQQLSITAWTSFTQDYGSFRAP